MRLVHDGSIAMTPDLFRKARELFEEALGLAGQERAWFLSRACGENAALRREVESLLAFSEEGDRFLNRSRFATLAHAAPVAESSPTAADTVVSGATFRIGRYDVVREIGQGGMGTVYLAVQTGEGFQKRAALKIIRRGMDTESVVKLFLSERRILASLEHPNIARLYDGGATQDGLPWFAMEYIEGENLQEYCDRRSLGLRARLTLFRQICAGVQYAHQALVVHRDIKPGNILVTRHGIPKLLDFGVARLVHSEETGRTMELTAAGTRAFTPQYASPEQVRGERITTSTDIFSLGLVLYQLVSGSHPYGKEMSSTSALLTAICEKEPPLPSAAAEARRARELKGDVDTIVLTALQKDPQRRYASIEQLSQDIGRYLEGLPVAARPDTLLYRAGKFVRRHRVSVAAAALVAVSLVGGAGAALWEARQARRNEAVAQRRFNDIRKLANSYLFEFHDAIRDLSGATPARLLVVRRGLEYLDSLSADAGGDPALMKELAAAYERLGDLQAGGQAGQLESNLGDNRGAVASFEKALALREKISARNPDRLGERRALANACGKLALARAHALLPAATITPLLEKAHMLLTDVVARAPHDRDARRDLALNQRHLVSLYEALAEPEKSVQAAREEALLFGRLAEEDPRSEEDRRQSGIALRNLGSRLTTAEGAALLRKAFETAEELARRDPTSAERQLDLADAWNALGLRASTRGESEEAERNLRKAFAIRSEVAGKDAINARPQTGLGESHSALARLELARGRLPQADKEATSGLEVISRFRAAHPEDARARGIQAGLLTTVARIREAQARGAATAPRRARLAEARDLYARSQGIYEEVVPTAPVAAGMAAAMARDVARCKMALAALPEP